ncbi:zinc finger protein 41-like isoform X2 [Ochlerotatus camptorhynchus]|uniref:zinc finger protein 41-like isoform X2 n=1 Tax=Ochlerotatus camptorhynchus TaxID=644619 RepID=UPI0031CE07F9
MDKNKAESTTRSRRSRCRLCRELCEPNKLLWDRDFREKLQDIICLWIKISPGAEKYHVCSSCQNQVEVFYSFKRRSRQILHGEKAGVLSSDDYEVPLPLETLLENCTNEVTLPPETLEELAQTSIDAKSLKNEYAKKDHPKPKPPKVKPVKKKCVTLPPETLSDLAPFLLDDHHQGQDDYDDNAQPGPLEEKPVKIERPFRRKYRRTEEEQTMTKDEYKKYYIRQYLDRCKKMCDICGKSIDPKRMDSHMNRHNGLQPYTCDECGLQFHCRMNLRKHINRSHAKGNEMTCDICGRVSSSKIAHTQHLRAVHEEKKFQCALCGVKTLTKALASHMDIHNQRRDFVCPQCGKAFYRKYVLSIHLRTHSGETPYKCHVCSEAFVHRRIYVMHMKKHHPDEPLMRIDGVKALKEALMKKNFV